jgi:hypothetical protein
MNRNQFTVLWWGYEGTKDLFLMKAQRLEKHSFSLWAAFFTVIVLKKNKELYVWGQ